jgi:cysteine desulfurase
MERIYLDHQATTPVSPGVAQAMGRYLLDVPGNPHSSDHAAGWLASDNLECARETVAAVIGGESQDLIFTSGATEANNIAILGVGGATGGRRRIVVSAIEHPAVMAPARELARRGFELVVVPCSSNGLVDPDEYLREVDERTLIASLMLVNNEIGTVQPVEKVAKHCRSAGALFHVDAAQALRWLPMNVNALGCTSLSLSSHKIAGPMGIGALWLDPDARHRLAPLQHGGEQEGGLRPGTSPGFLAVGFAKAVSELPGTSAVALWRTETERLWTALQDAVPGLALNGAASPRHPGNLNILLPTCDADVLIAALQPTVAISQGSACTSGHPEPSHVLRALGLSSPEASRSIRISTSPTTTRKELDLFAEAFGTAVLRTALTTDLEGAQPIQK